MASRTTTMQWLFFIGPDGIVRSTRGRNQTVTNAALACQGLAEKLGHSSSREIRRAAGGRMPARRAPSLSGAGPPLRGGPAPPSLATISDPQIG